MTPADILDRAADYVDRGWCQMALARDAEGNEREPHDDNAVRWCATGALYAAQGRARDYDAEYAARSALSAVLGDRGVTSWNDRLPPGSGPIVAAKMREAAQWWREEQGHG